MRTAVCQFAARRCPATGTSARVEVYADDADASRAVAQRIAEVIRNRAREGRPAVLGLATGSTPLSVYEELVRMHRTEGLSFRNVTTFNLDEYWPMSPDSLQSYRRFMRESLFDLVDIDPARTHIPDGTLAAEAIAAHCAELERRIAEAGGIDLQLLGIGRTGHIGFNEPGSSRDSRTRLVTLDRVTRLDAASDFFGERHVPRRAITLGVGTILEARRIVLLAFGEHKAPVIRQAIEGEVTPMVTASFLQEHPDATFVLDGAAAAELTRFKAPWLMGSLEGLGLAWDAAMVKRAVIWLALRVGKPILKLTEPDYVENGLQELLSVRGSAYDINIEVFKSLQQTITGWPGGKPPPPADSSPQRRALRGANAVEPAAARSGGPDVFVHVSTVFPKRVVVFSPHPDDDVISMGGTFIRLCEQGHEVHVAYQTSGSIAVWDDAARRHMDFVIEFCRAFDVGAGVVRSREIAEQIHAFLRDRNPGQIESPELARIKALIRRTEARAAAVYSGVRPENIHFLDLPFYETGRIRKKPLADEDVRRIVELLDRIAPHQIYAAGDLSDPHGTHRVCLKAILSALERLRDRAWRRDCEIWLYRGAWQEWGAHEIEMAVPLSPDEVERKRTAIFKHESQKDKALFPGPSDPREFWQRAEDRNRATAQLYDKLGLPEYQALEGFVRLRLKSGASALSFFPDGNEPACQQAGG